MTDTVRTRSNPKWIRGTIRGSTVVDSRDVLFAWEHSYYPAWYFPLDAVRGTLVANGETFRSADRGEGTWYDLDVDGHKISKAAWRHLDSPVEALRERVRFEWDAVDAWFEEDVEVFVHPRSPEVRVDVLPSSQHVRVFVDGEVVADSTRPSILFEAELPSRYYLPKSDVRMDMLTATDTESACPYKGWAHYWSVTVGGNTHTDIAWGYRTPLPESHAVSGLVCFYNEKVDIEVDGVMIDRPQTKFS